MLGLREKGDGKEWRYESPLFTGENAPNRELLGNDSPFPLERKEFNSLVTRFGEYLFSGLVDVGEGELVELVKEFGEEEEGEW